MSAASLADKAKDLVRALRAAHEDNAILRAERATAAEVRVLREQNSQYIATNTQLEQKNVRLEQELAAHKRELAALRSEHEQLKSILEDEWELISGTAGPEK